MVGARHVDHAPRTDVAVRALDGVAQLRLVGAAGPLDRVDCDHQPVVGVAAESRDVGLVLGLVVALVGNDNRLLGIAGGKDVGDQQRCGRKTHAFRRVAGELDELLRGDAVRLIERHGEAELLVVLGDDRRPLSEPAIEHRLDARRPLDLGELRGHVGVRGAVTLVGDDIDAVLAGDFHAFGVHRLVEAAGARNQRELA